MISGKLSELASETNAFYWVIEPFAYDIGYVIVGPGHPISSSIGKESGLLVINGYLTRK